MKCNYWIFRFKLHLDGTREDSDESCAGQNVHLYAAIRVSTLDADDGAIRWRWRWRWWRRRYH